MPTSLRYIFTSTKAGDDVSGPSFRMTINGAPTSAEDSFNVINPATEEVIAHAPQASRRQLDAAMEAARVAYPGWAADEIGRREALRRAANAVLGAANRLAPLVTAEQGKPLADASLEVMATGAWLKYFADLAIPREVVRGKSRGLIEVLRRPMGVVAAITPWNFPLMLAAWKLAPALLAGNTVVLKPSPYAPLAMLTLGELLGAIFPPGVVNVISGGDDLGEWMTSHSVPRKVSFTGSVATGKRVAAAAAGDLKRVTLELGGNDPAIILDDVDPAAIAESLFWGAFQNNGQVCSAIKRVYAPANLFDAVVEALAERAGRAKVGNGAHDGIELGPIGNRPQFERVSELVADAVSEGARIVIGGDAIPGPGYFYKPTILTGVDDGSRIVDEEQFGPALPVIRYSTLDQAITGANSSHFGLCASVWAADIDRAVQVADRLDCGTVWVNSHMALQPDQPFGGMKWSGIGVENGRWGLEQFTEIKVIHRVMS